MPARSEPVFDVDFNRQMVKCKAQRNDLVTIGIDGTWSTRLTVKKRVNEDAEAAALRKLGDDVAGAARSSADAATAGPAAAPADAPGLLGSPAIFLDEVDSAVGAGRKRTEVKPYSPGSSETCGRAHTLRDKCSKSGRRRPSATRPARPRVGRLQQAEAQRQQDLRAALEYSLVRIVSNVSPVCPVPLATHQPLTRVFNASRQAAAQQELRACRLRESAQLAVSNAAMASVAALSRDVACSAADAAQQRKAARAAAAVAEKERHKLLQAEQQLAQARQRPPRLPRQQRRPQIPKGVRAVFQDLETVLSEANLFADDPLPPLSSDFGVLCDQ